jgi:hypothetical protein
MTDDNMQMDEHEFMKANFFSSDEEFAAAKAEAEAARVKRKHRPKMADDIKALLAFVRLIERVDDHCRVAAVSYLVDRYIGYRARQRVDWARSAAGAETCASCGTTEASDGDWYRLCGKCRWSAAGAETPAPQ